MGEGLVVRVGWQCGIPWEELAVRVEFCVNVGMAGRTCEHRLAILF